jgi:hypothetical protein
MMVTSEIAMITGALASTTSPPYVYNSYALYNVTRDSWMSVNTTGQGTSMLESKITGDSDKLIVLYLPR